MNLRSRMVNTLFCYLLLFPMFMFLDLKKAFGVQNPKNIFFKIFLLEVVGDECQILNGLLLFFCYLPLFPMFMFLDLKKAFGVQNQKKIYFLSYWRWVAMNIRSRMTFYSFFCYLLLFPMFMFLDLEKAFDAQNQNKIEFKILLLEADGDESHIVDGFLLFFCYLLLFPTFMLLDLKKAFDVQNQKKRIF